MGFRTEADFLGKVRVPSSAYYGIFTVRASSNFRLSQSKPDRNFIRMLALVKKSCAEANMATGELEAKAGRAIIQAASEVAAGKFDSQFILDSFTAGAGTPFNMNMNEVIANRANEILGAPLGSYRFVHPNNSANMSQSSNDVIPTAIRLTLLEESGELLEQAGRLADAIEAKARKFRSVIKAGRTHLMDAVPLTVGDELSAHFASIRQDMASIRFAAGLLRELPIGATALGSGINTHPDYRRIAVERIAANTRIRVRQGKNLFRLLSSANDFLAYSSAQRLLAVSILKLSNDLKLLSSGPATMVGEYLLPEVEPGSSIMPGKVNPSIPEAAEMVANRVLGNDQSVLLAAAGGQLQLNVQTPLILHCLSSSNRLLANCCRMLREKCIEGLRIDPARIQKNLDSSLIALTALAPYFGYAKMSEVVKKAQKDGLGIKEAVLREGLLSEAEYEELMSPRRLTRPAKRKRLAGKRRFSRK
ncbi:MAG: aspartate ammonia-lyase [Candidatus Micrarchaeota archaeon]|nr:aspartate ammonia-lyase [Candidatus Micrarchaeota archaeon]